MGTKGTLVLEKELEAMLFKSTSTSTKIKIDKDKQGGAGSTRRRAADMPRPSARRPSNWARSAVATPRNSTLGLVHQESVVGRQAPLPSGCGPGRRRIALTTNQVVRDGKGPFLKFEDAWFDIDNDATPEGERPDTTRKDYSV